MSLHPANRVTDPSDLDPAFLRFYEPFHRRFTPWQQTLSGARKDAMDEAHADRRKRPDHQRIASPNIRGDWMIALPDWLRDQRNQMTGNVDSAKLAVKLMNSGSPGVMLDLEDSMGNTWANAKRGIANAIAALHGTLTYVADDGQAASITGNPVTFVRARGLHMSQHGVFPEGPTSASLFDVVSVIYGLDPAKLKHPPCIYIPKSESWMEASWWAELFKELAIAKGQPSDWIRCMALVESHPLCYQMEEFAYHLRANIVGFNLGRWDLMASIGHWNLPDPEWVLPDRDTIPSNVEFFQRPRYLMVELCHKHGMLAIGGMTALFPDRGKKPENRRLNAVAMEVLEKDKKGESDVGMDGAWTGHPDQNDIAVAQFPAPNQLHVRYPDRDRWPDLRPVPAGVGAITEAGTRRAVRATIEYRAGILDGRGASLIRRPSDNAPVMEDLATDRIFRVMIAQRIRHGHVTPAAVARMYDEEALALAAAVPRAREAAHISLAMIVTGEFDPS